MTLDPKTKQVIAEKALMSMAENQPEMAEDMDSVMLGVTSRDMNYESLNLRYGTNLYIGRFSIVSTARLHEMPWYAGTNPEVFAIRTRKLVTRNLSLLHFPVDRSSDATSALSIDVYTAPEVDEMGESFGGQDGKAQLVPLGPPCVTILQGPNGKQGWRLGCINESEGDGRFERFETFTGVPLFVMSRVDFSFKGQPSFPFVRKYRPHDDRSRPFGIGATDSFDIFPVGDSQTFAWIELILEGGEESSFYQDFFRDWLYERGVSRGKIAGGPIQPCLSGMEWQRVGPLDKRRLDVHISIERGRQNLATGCPDRHALGLR